MSEILREEKEHGVVVYTVPGGHIYLIGNTACYVPNIQDLAKPSNVREVKVPLASPVSRQPKKAAAKKEPVKKAAAKKAAGKKKADAAAQS